MVLSIISEISKQEAKSFLSKYHIQGYVGSRVNFGLHYNDELLSVASFGQARFAHKYDWELLRLATKAGYHVTGGASRLISNFRKHNVGSLISYADRSWSQGNVYSQLGFEFLHNTGPGFQYVIRDKRENRQKFQKHKLSALLENFDINLTADHNLINHDIYKIYDCGNSVWVLN